MTAHSSHQPYSRRSPAAALLADAVSRAAVGMALVAADGVIRFANPLFAAAAGAAPASLPGRSLDDLFRPCSPPDLARALADGGFFSLSVTIPRADGGSRRATLDLAPLAAAGGGADLLARLRDTGDDAAPPTALARAPDPPARPAAGDPGDSDDPAGQPEPHTPPLAPGEMVALLRRELREPLTSIRGYAELIADLVRDPDEMAGLARIIHGEALHLAWLLEELALLERLAGGDVELRIRPTDLNAVAAEAARRLGPEAGGAVITLDLDAGLLPVPADRDALLQLITGLARGALRGAGPGSVIGIETSRARRRALLSVSGGAPVTDPRGLGLPIARGIARLHGGRAWAETRPGGPVIRVALPVAPAVTPPPRASSADAGT